MRVIVGRRDIDRPAASTNTMSRLEIEVLTQDGNVEGLGCVNAEWVDGAMSRTPHRRVILDMDSSESPVHGEQEGSSYNGHFGSMCYHPLFVFNQFGDCEGAMLRAGNVHSSHRWRDVLDPVLSRYGATGVRRYFRADAASAKPGIYEYLEEQRVFYAIRLPSNKVLQWEITPLLIRPVGRPPKRPVIRYDDFWYRAESWDRARRVVAKVEWYRGELFPRVGFIVTNMTAGPERPPSTVDPMRVFLSSRIMSVSTSSRRMLSTAATTRRTDAACATSCGLRTPTPLTRPILRTSPICSVIPMEPSAWSMTGMFLVSSRNQCGLMPSRGQGSMSQRSYKTQFTWPSIWATVIIAIVYVPVIAGTWNPEIRPVGNTLLGLLTIFILSGFLALGMMRLWHTWKRFRSPYWTGMRWGKRRRRSFV